MWSILKARWCQGYRTAPYPSRPPALPDRFRGRPELAAGLPDTAFVPAAAVCPTGAFTAAPGLSPSLDLGRCLFCGACAAACPAGVSFTAEHRLAARRTEDLRLIPDRAPSRAVPMEDALRRLFGRSLRLRQVCAGGCGACEADSNVLGTPTYDMGRFGIQFVASPRHADGLYVTGPVTENMRLALRKTYDAMANPKVVIAVGACAIGGGPYRDHPEVHNGAASVIPVDLLIPGCPPHPYTILDGLLRFLGRIP
ncbi:MAG: NADH-quinone oxidoreductase subunit NuoB [bacterium]